VLALFFLDPLVVYLPGDIDHHNAQVALVIATVACAMRIDHGARWGFLAACSSALTLAIGLEMLPHVVVIGAFIALRWAATGRDGRAVAAYAATLAVLPADLYAVSGSPAAAWACDSLSFAYTIPAAIVGFGLAGLALSSGWLAGRSVRFAGLAILGTIGAVVFALATPACLGGPYGFLSPELKAIWLDTVTEAQPFQVYAEREPVGAFGSLMPLLVALVVAALHLWRGEGEKRVAWLLQSLLMAVTLSTPDPHASLRGAIAIDPRHMAFGLPQLDRAHPESREAGLSGRHGVSCGEPGHLPASRPPRGGRARLRLGWAHQAARDAEAAGGARQRTD
jgi:hypothetical protein